MLCVFLLVKVLLKFSLHLKYSVMLTSTLVVIDENYCPHTVLIWLL